VSPIDWRVELARLHTLSFAWALHCCRHRPEEAQDVLHEVYVRVLEGRARYAGHASTKTWLFAVIRRTAREQRRRRWLRTALIERWLQHGPSSDPLAVSERELDDAKANARLRAALDRLSPRQREVLHLVYYQELTIEEAAGLAGISLGSARTHFERGKARLREQLQGSTSP
jgi:RNA polymerase sigma-70 factor (ECF subfamily)